MTEHILISQPEPGIALVELARGKVNAIDHRMYGELAETFDRLSDDPTVNVAVLTGRGHVFCAGNDLNDFRTMDTTSGELQMRNVRRAMFNLIDCSIPVIAAVNGPALGSGLGLTASCDLVVASEKATFGLPEMNVGVLGGGRFTARMLPQQAMRRLFFTAEAVDAHTLERWGAPIEVVPHDTLMNTALTRARSIASKSRYALTLAKQSLNGCEGMDLKRGYELEQTFTVRLSEHPDSKTAVEARMAALTNGKNHEYRNARIGNTGRPGRVRRARHRVAVPAAGPASAGHRHRPARKRREAVLRHLPQPHRGRRARTTRPRQGWQSARVDAGFGAITWCPEWGGPGLTASHERIYVELERQFRAPERHETILVTVELIAPTIHLLGTEEQKQRFVQPFLRADELCCQLFSEPGAGSDLAALTTRSVRTDTGWKITGQKVWSSGAQFAEWGLLIARSDPAAPKHRGMTAFLVPMDAPGVETRPIRQMSGGSTFNEVFLTDVELPDSLRLGEVATVGTSH